MVNEALTRRIGAKTMLTKPLSEADVSLFALVMGEAPLEAADPPSPMRMSRQVVPGALLAALLTSVAARHAARPALARFLSERIAFSESAYSDDVLTATAEVTGYDEAQRGLRIQAHCETQDGRRLIEGEFLLAEG